VLQSMRLFKSSSISDEEFNQLAMLQSLRMHSLSSSIAEEPFDSLAVLHLLRMFRSSSIPHDEFN
jgi:hypothetical protein